MFHFPVPLSSVVCSPPSSLPPSLACRCTTVPRPRRCEPLKRSQAARGVQRNGTHTQERSASRHNRPLRLRWTIPTQRTRRLSAQRGASLQLACHARVAAFLSPLERTPHTLSAGSVPTISASSRPLFSSLAGRFSSRSSGQVRRPRPLPPQLHWLPSRPHSAVNATDQQQPRGTRSHHRGGDATALVDSGASVLTSSHCAPLVSHRPRRDRWEHVSAATPRTDRFIPRSPALDLAE